MYRGRRVLPPRGGASRALPHACRRLLRLPAACRPLVTRLTGRADPAPTNGRNGSNGGNGSSDRRPARRMRPPRTRAVRARRAGRPLGRRRSARRRPRLQRRRGARRGGGARHARAATFRRPRRGRGARGRLRARDLRTKWEGGRWVGRGPQRLRSRCSRGAGADLSARPHHCPRCPRCCRCCRCRLRARVAPSAAAAAESFAPGSPARASLSTARPPARPVPSGPRHLVVFVCSPQRRELRVQARHFLPPTQARLAARAPPPRDPTRRRPAARAPRPATRPTRRARSVPGKLNLVAACAPPARPPPPQGPVAPSTGLAARVSDPGQGGRDRGGVGQEQPGSGTGPSPVARAPGCSPHTPSVRAPAPRSGGSACTRAGERVADSQRLLEEAALAVGGATAAHACSRCCRGPRRGSATAQTPPPLVVSGHAASLTPY